MNELQKVLNGIENWDKVTFSGLNEGEKAFLPYFFNDKTIILTSNEEQLLSYQETLTRLGKKVVAISEKLPLLITICEKNSKEFRDYYIALSNLAKNEWDILLLTPSSIFQKVPTKDYVLSHSLSLKVGEDIPFEKLINSLVSMGYKRQDVVLDMGEFSIKGDIVDIFPIGESNPIKVSFFDTEIESIKSFDVETYKFLNDKKETTIFCNSFVDLNAINYEKIEKNIKNDLAILKIKDENMLRISDIVATQLDYLHEKSNFSAVFFAPYLDYFSSSILDYTTNACLLFDEPKLIFDKLGEINGNNVESFLELSMSGEFLPKNMEFYFSLKEILAKISTFKQLAYARLVSQNKFFESKKIINFICPHVPKYINNYIELANQLKDYLSNKYTIALSITDSLNLNKMKNILEEKSLKYFVCDDLKDIKSGAINILKNGPLYSINFEMERLLIVGEKDLVSHIKTTSIAVKQSTKTRFLPKVGDFVVHEVHGIGKCVGIEKLRLTSVSRDYIIIEYRDGDKLYVPSENTDLLSAFSGEGEPKCNKIGGTEFYKIKQKVKSSIKQMTFDLVKVYGERLNLKGYKYSKDTYLQDAFEKSFPYEYTDDQKKALSEIKKDLESNRIMDRLLCGDVGFGKTEIALATAFKVIQDGKQVAFICPTTILCEQHFATCMSRLSNFFVRVGCLNRFKSEKEQLQIKQDLKDGKIDIVVGTHKLLGKDVKFKDLGLIIIDEEQRFGVDDKDKLKNIKKSVDVLSLSATPIPRTLYMSLVGIRDVSFLATPPRQRKKIVTQVIDYSDSLLISACKKELERDGQVLIVYNKVALIANFYSHVKSLIPDARIGFAHGQMDSKTLESAIYDLYSRKTQILISTVLIENGIDLPYANTLFVVDADKLGLSQLYQLRGRVGRSNIEAYAYFSFSKNKTLSADSYKRLDAIMEFSDFGSGYKLAMRDLEIRGAGDILGRNQHGHMQQVGYDMYVKLLNEAVRELRGEDGQEKREVKINIDIDAFIPVGFIDSSEAKIDLYSKVSRLTTKEEYLSLLEEIKSKYGSLPAQVKQLCLTGLIKNLSQKLLISKIVLNSLGARLYFYEDAKNKEFFKKFDEQNSLFCLIDDKMPIISIKKEQDNLSSEQNLLKFLEKFGGKNKTID